MIYFLDCNHQYVKIGFSGSPARRLNDLRAGNPYDLTILKEIDVSQKAEAYLHNKFSHLRHRGEWFYLNSELREYIATEAETDLRQFEQAHPPYSKPKYPILFTPKRADGTLAYHEGFSLDSGRIYSAEGIARICAFCDLDPNDFVIVHDGVSYEDFDNDVFIAAKKRVERILQNDD